MSKVTFLQRKMGQAIFSHRCTHVVVQSPQCACMTCAPPFSLQGFPTFFLLTYPHTAVLETLIDNVKLNFFYLSVLWNYYAYTYSFFDNISHTVCEKTAIHSLVCLLRSLLLTTCSVIVQTSSTIWQFSF